MHVGDDLGTPGIKAVLTDADGALVPVRDSGLPARPPMTGTFEPDPVLMKAMSSKRAIRRRLHPALQAIPPDPGLQP